MVYNKRTCWEPKITLGSSSVPNNANLETIEESEKNIHTNLANKINSSIKDIGLKKLKNELSL